LLIDGSIKIDGLALAKNEPVRKERRVATITPTVPIKLERE
jgi:hypothetical protein